MDDKTNPGWQTHSIETVYENAWIAVSHREVTAPTGQAGIYGLVHFKQRAIGVVPLDASGHTWLVGQERYTLGQYSWEIPEGGATVDEEALHAAKRELQEETGITAKRWTPLLELHTSNSVTDEHAKAWVAQELEFGDTSPDETEVLHVKRVTLDDAVQMVLDGEITDSFAMASLMKVKLMLDRGLLQLT